MVTFPLAEVSRPKQPGARPAREMEEEGLSKRLERIILQRYRPACVTVKENGDAVYFSGRLNDYLEHPTGNPDINVVNLAREGLRIPLRAALHRAATTRTRIVQKQISVQRNGGFSQVDLTVEPIAEFNTANLYMVVFEDTASSAPPQPAAPPADADSEETIRHLEDELRSAQEHAQTMFEELESSNEELKSANEEYQSTNEELETSKEELQSFNEELLTVNAEISRKSAELDHANSDLQNLLNSTEIATIFLDGDLRIKFFTPAAGTVFRLIPGDTGRQITDLVAQFSDVDLVADIRETLRTLKGRERPLVGMGGRYYLLRVLPYRTVRNVIDGVVLTFTDVTQAKQVAQLVDEAKIYAEDIVDTVGVPLLVLDAGLGVKSANAAFFEKFQAAPAETLNIPLDRLWSIPELSRILGEVISANKKIEDWEVEYDFPAVGRKNILLNARQIRPHGASEPLILLAVEDITARKRAEAEQRAGEARYRALFDLCPIAIYACDTSGVIREFNPRAAELWGRAPERGDTDERFCGSLKMHRADGTFMPHEQCPMAEVLTGAIPEARDMELQIERPDGSWVSVIVNIRALRNERGEITGAINCFVDITERKRADKELRRLNSDLQQFSYAASHDLQEPLRMVMSYTELLAKEYKDRLDDRADQFIANAVNGAQRMESLLRDLREYWTVNEQKAERLVPVDCNRVLEKALAYLEMPIRESGAVVTHDSLPTVTAE
ncbi:MAG: PAS domain-containing protein, partial [Acidobacteriota bacterium]|nr:PAS domain-containing protein [Acidobacteriota bacterium]